MKKYLLAFGILTLGVIKVYAGNYYDSPKVSTYTGYAEMGLVGTFYIYNSSTSRIPVIIIQSTHGITISSVPFAMTNGTMSLTLDSNSGRAQSLLIKTISKNFNVADSTSGLGTNGDFTWLSGNYAWANHIHMPATTVGTIAQAIGVHGPGQTGQLYAVDDSTNSGTAIRIFQYGANANDQQDLFGIEGQTLWNNYIGNKTYTNTGSFTGDYIQFNLAGGTRCRMSYDGSIWSYDGGANYMRQYNNGSSGVLESNNIISIYSKLGAYYFYNAALTKGIALGINTGGDLTINGGSGKVITGVMNIDSVTVNGTYVSTNGINVGGSTFTTVNASKFSGDGSLLSNIPSTTDYSIYGLIISSNGADLNLIQSTISFINIMGDNYYNVKTTASLATSGLGGLDTGAEAASKWYGIWAISNGSAMNIVFSDAGNIQPVLPAGFTKWRRIGWVYNDSGSNIVPFRKVVNTVSVFPSQLFINTNPPTTGAWTDFDMTPYISTTAYSATIGLWVDNSGAADTKVWVRCKSDRNINPSFGDFDVTALPANGSDVQLKLQLFDKPQSWKYYASGTFGQLYANLLSYEEW